MSKTSRRKYHRKHRTTQVVAKDDREKLENSALTVVINGNTYVMAWQPTGDVVGVEGYLMNSNTVLDLRGTMHVRIDVWGINAHIQYSLLRPRRMDNVTQGLVLMIPITAHVVLQFFGMYLVDDAFQMHAQPEVTFDVPGKYGRYLCSAIRVQCANAVT